jgi:hypothetical protein
MTRRQRADTPRLGGGTAEPTVRGVFGTALGTYRRRFGTIALAAIAIFAPVDLLLVPITTLMQRYGDARDAEGMPFLSARAAARRRRLAVPPVQLRVLRLRAFLGVSHALLTSAGHTDGALAKTRRAQQQETSRSAQGRAS